MRHNLKIDRCYLNNLLSGRKKVEIRINDRDYQLGDILIFTDLMQTPAIEHRFSITHVHSGLGLAQNYVALSIEYKR